MNNLNHQIEVHILARVHGFIYLFWCMLNLRKKTLNSGGTPDRQTNDEDAFLIVRKCYLAEHLKSISPLGIVKTLKND